MFQDLAGDLVRKALRGAVRPKSRRIDPTGYTGTSSTAPTSPHDVLYTIRQLPAGNRVSPSPCCTAGTSKRSIAGPGTNTKGIDFVPLAPSQVAEECFARVERCAVVGWITSTIQVISTRTRLKVVLRRLRVRCAVRRNQRLIVVGDEHGILTVTPSTNVGFIDPRRSDTIECEVG